MVAYVASKTGTSIQALLDEPLERVLLEFEALSMIEREMEAKGESLAEEIKRKRRRLGVGPYV